MLAKARTPNPHYPDSPSRMADGRLFTDYRGNCKLVLSDYGGSFEDKQRLQQTGTLMINADRSVTVMKAASLSCVDTMVPEATKRVAGWNGGRTLVAHAAGIGQGRLYLPGRTDLVAGDPDVLAAATAFDFGTFSANPNMYMAGGGADVTARQVATVTPARPNRYSVPYGN
jgi:hypothetical protein